MIEDEEGTPMNARPDWLEEDSADVEEGNAEFLTDNEAAATEPHDAAGAWEKAQMRACILSHVLAVTSAVLVGVWVSDESVGGGGVSWKAGDAQRVFNWHPVLMVMAFAFMTVASLAFRASWRSSKRWHNKLLHSIQWTVALICGIVGVVAVVKSHNDQESGYIANLYSLHSWIGCGVILMYLCQFFVGAAAFGFQVRWISVSARAKLIYLHRFVGSFTYNAAAATILLGIQEKEGFIGCSYSVDTADTFPPVHFMDIPGACRISHSLGLIILVTTLSTNFAMYNFGLVDSDRRNR